jgi:adenosylhomocysteine nucleosidase
MRTGIIGAMDEEIVLFLEAMEETKKTVKAGITYYQGKLESREVVLCKSGVGKVNAGVCTQILIDRFGVDQVIFTGVAGAVHPDLEIGDIVISTTCLQHDVDATALGFQPGEIPYAKIWEWQADPRLIELAMKSGEAIGDDVNIVKGKVLSGDQFIADRDKVRRLYERFDAYCTEMEGAAAAQVCTMNDVPFVIVRSMSDKADGSADVNFAEFTKLASRRSFEIVSSMLKHESPAAGAGVIVYSTAGCIECDMVKKLLTEQGIPFEVRDVMTSQQYRDEVEKFGFLGVPVTVVGGKAVKGFQPEELQPLLDGLKK